MLIGIDGSEAFVKNKTGVENYAYQVIRNLAKIDRHNRYIIYLDPRVNSLSEVGNWPDNFTFQSLKCPLFWTQAGLAVRTFLDPLDLLFSPSHTTPLLHRRGLKTVITVHDLGAQFLPLKHQLKQILYLRWISMVQLRLATKLIAVSEATKKDLISQVGIKDEKIKVIYEGLVPLREGKSDVKVDSLKRFGIKNKNYFLFVGTIQPRKNLDRLIRAFDLFLRTDPVSSQPRLLPPALVLAGPKGWDADEIYLLPKKLGIEDKVKFLGRVDDADLPSLYSHALALVYPSLFEGFGLPILEAFRFDCPVITSNVSSMPETAGRAAVLVDPYSERQIREALLKISKDNTLRQNLIKSGRRQLKKFSWEKAAVETLRLLKSV